MEYAVYPRFALGKRRLTRLLSADVAGQGSGSIGLMKNTTLTEFIAHARLKGMDHATIRMLLLSSGWKEKDVAQALSDQTLDMPVPQPPDLGGARDAFLHLVNFACLYTTLIGVIVVLFTSIERYLPDAATDTSFYAYDAGALSTLRWWIAALIVVFPLFMWISRKLLHEMTLRPERARSGVRRWLTYLTLFFAAMALMGDGITLVFRLLEGELTLRFILKVIVVFAATGMTFAYYLLSVVRGTDRLSDKAFHRGFALAAMLAVVAVLAWGMVQVGSPASERLRKFDERRVEDLRAIQSEILNFAYAGRQWDSAVSKPVKPVPETLDEMVQQAAYQRLHVTDPETGAPYEYVVRDAVRYELCAVFAATRSQDFDIQWNHPAGRHCFTFDVSDVTRK